MKLQDEINSLQTRIANGELDPDLPVFVLMGKDAFAAPMVEQWADLVEDVNGPCKKSNHARHCAEDMRRWPVKKIPGRNAAGELRPDQYETL